jgi:hydrogenase-1 operon protein HyaF
MGGIDSIPVRFDPRHSSGLTGNARPVLSELAALADRLASAGEPGAIDLQALPLSPADLAWLRETLGRGEVSATIEAAGPSSVEETGFPGVWWMTHRNANGQVVAELIEVATVPEIVRSARSEAGTSAARLRAIASEGGGAKEIRA